MNVPNSSTRIGTIRLKPRMARPFFGRHPWVFEGAIQSVERGIEAGNAVRVVADDGTFVAYGLFNPASKIRVRLYSWDIDRPIDVSLIQARIERAIRWRDQLGLSHPAGAVRVVYSESDGLSGLIVDRYADVLVVQITSLGMASFRDVIIDELQRSFQSRCVYLRTERGIGAAEGLELEDGLIAGVAPDAPIVVQEDGLEWLVDVRAGQKTGAYLDQRDNRRALCRYTAARSVLDLYCYGGGFGIAAAKWGGAASVLGVDSSEPALELARRNAERNGVQAEFRRGKVISVGQELLREGRRFGVVVCDPPKLVRTASALERAANVYQEINELAISLLEPGGLLLTCSCSGLMDRDYFVAILVAASQAVGRELHILEQRGQSPDHPVSVYCRETEYLKCVIARGADD